MSADEQAVLALLRSAEYPLTVQEMTALLADPDQSVSGAVLTAVQGLERQGAVRRGGPSRPRSVVELSGASS